MPGTDDHLQNQDVQVLIKGSNIPVYVDDDMADRFGDGWRGGQFVTYTGNTFGDGPTLSKNIRVVEVSDGTKFAGMLLRGSEFHPNVQTPGGTNLRSSEYNYSSYQPKNTRVVTMMFDGSYAIKIYEKYEYPTRDSGTELTYSINDTVYLSDRGLITTYDDAIASGITDPVFVGTVWLVPSDDNDNRIGFDRF